MDSKVRAKCKKCTKEELIWLLEYMDSHRMYSLEYALIQVDGKRIETKLKEAENWSQIAYSCRTRYVELLEVE